MKDKDVAMMEKEKLKIIDTFSEIAQCFSNDKFNRNQWEIYADSISPDLKDKILMDVKKYNFSQDIVPVLDAFVSKHEKFIMVHNAFLNVTKGLSGQILNKLGTEIDASIIFYLGLCNGAGWATELEGRPTVLLGIEKIVELSWYNRENMIALIYHELGHIWHFQARKIASQMMTLKEKSLWQLYTEGFAMHIEHLLCDDHTFYHQDTDGWLNWCNENKDSLYNEFIRRIYNEECTQQFFGDWYQLNGKSDIGYFLGSELIRSLSNDYSLLELANLELEIIEDKLRELYA